MPNILLVDDKAVARRTLLSILDVLGDPPTNTHQNATTRALDRSQNQNHGKVRTAINLS